MKIKRFLALAALAVIVTATMSFFVLNVFAQNSEPAVQGAVQDCEGDDDDAAETVETGPDLDDVEVECGPQDKLEDGAEEYDTDDIQDEHEDQADDAMEVETDQ